MASAMVPSAFSSLVVKLKAAAVAFCPAWFSNPPWPELFRVIEKRPPGPAVHSRTKVFSSGSRRGRARQLG